MRKVCSCTTEELDQLEGGECNCPDLFTWFRQAVDAYDSMGSLAAAIKERDAAYDHVRKLLMQERAYVRTINGLIAERDKLQQMLNDMAVGG